LRVCNARRGAEDGGENWSLCRRNAAEDSSFWKIMAQEMTENIGERQNSARDPAGLIENLEEIVAKIVVKEKMMYPSVRTKFSGLKKRSIRT